METYDIYLGTDSVGQAIMHKEGLYYCFRCCCTLETEMICTVTVFCGTRQASLGVLVPEGGTYTLCKRVPIKQLGTGNFRFAVAPKKQQTEGKYIPIYPEEPFQYIQKLQNAYLQRRKDGMGIVISE